MPKDLGHLAKGQRRKIGIKWLKTEKLRPGFGHGVEFWYSKGNTRNEDTDILVAIVEGYRWLHNPVQKWVTVKILPKSSPVFGRSTVPPDEIISAIRFGARRFFETRPRDAKVAKEVFVWWNA